MFKALLCDWYDEYVAKPVSKNQLREDVKKVKIHFFASLTIGVFIFIVSLFTFLHAGNNISLKLEALAGLLIGISICNLTKIWCHVQLSKLKTLWMIDECYAEKTEDELRKIKASDL